MLKNRRFILVMLILSVIFATFSSVAFADNSATINASCSNGAYANLSGSGWITVTFYFFGGGSYSTSVNFGGGMSRQVISTAAGSYSYVYASGSTTGGMSAGCR